MVESVKLMRCFVLSDGRCSLKSNRGNTERLEMVNHFKDRNRNEPGQDVCQFAIVQVNIVVFACSHHSSHSSIRSRNMCVMVILFLESEHF